MAVGEVLRSPVSSTVVTQLAPVELRGRYLGAWTLVWMFGASLGPTAGGFLLDALGGRGLFTLVLLSGLAGGVGFPLLRRSSRDHLTLAVRRLRRA
jgi:MFS family permease